MAILGLLKRVPTAVAVGSQLATQIIVRNLGPDTALNVQLTDTLPDGASVVLVSPGCTRMGNIVTCTLGDIAPGETRELRITFVPMVPGLIFNFASAQGMNTNVAQDAGETLVLPIVDLAMPKIDAPDPALVGQPLTYTLTITNPSANLVTGVTIVEPLPPSVTFLSASGPCTLGPGNVLTCTIEAIPAQSSTAVQITVIPTSAGLLSNTVTVDATNASPVTGGSQTTVIGAADLAVTKAAITTDPQVGRGLIYEVTVRNNGPSTATGVTLTDELPPGVRFVSATPSQGTGSRSDRNLACMLGALAPGGTATVRIVVVPLTAGRFTNTACVAGNEPDPNPNNNTDGVTVCVTQCGPPCCPVPCPVPCPIPCCPRCC